MDLGEWLKGLGLGQYEARFREHEIDADILSDLTEADLEKIGLPLGARKRLMKGIAGLASTEARPSAGAPGPPPETSVRTRLQRMDLAERRPVTVMFCDLVGSTSIAAKLDAEDWRDLVNAYLDEASTAVTGFGGHVLKRLGDGLMALFGYPQAQENDAERAVRAGLAILAALEALNSKNAGSKLPALAARIGLESGPVVVDGTGEVFGEAPNVAARVQGVAEPGIVLVTASVQRQIAGLFVAEEKGAHELKGVPAAVTLYRIVRASGGGRRGGARSLTPFVGHEEDLAVLLRRWDRARGGEGQLAQIIGEPGLGKSRLLEEFRARIGATPHTWIEWSSSQLLQNTPLHPLAEWGRLRFGGAELAPEKRLAELESALAQVKLDPPEHVALLAPVLDIPLPEARTSELTPEELRRRQLAALTAWLLAGARTQAIVLAFEDLHWADPTSLDLLKTLAERGAVAPLFILATARPEFRAPWATRSHHAVVSLVPLERAEIRQMVGAIAERHALSNDSVEGVADRTGGVPLFVEEVTRLLIEGGAQTIPPTLQQSLAARLDRLGEAREVAQIGAVLGREFSDALLHSVAAGADRGYNELALRLALDKLAEADLLFVEGVPPVATYRFKHALIQDAAYDSLLKSRRQALHRRAADALIAAPDPQPELVAHHFTQAGEIEPAVEWWGKAGDAALRRSAFQEAIAHLGKAIAMADKAADAASTPSAKSTAASASQRLKFQTGLGQAMMRSRGFASDESKTTFARARNLAAGAGDARERFDAYYGLFVGSLLRGELSLAGETAESFLREAENEGRMTEVAVARRNVGVARLCQGDFIDARTEFTEALRIYDPERDRNAKLRFGVDTAAGAAGYLALASWALGDVERAQVLAEEALGRADGAAHAPTRALVYHYISLYQLLRGDPEAVRRIARIPVELGREHGMALYLAFGEVHSNWARARLGGGESEVSELRRSLAAYVDQGNKNWAPLFQGLLAELEAEARDVDGALRRVDEALALANETGEHWTDAVLHRIRGQILLKRDPAKTAPAEETFQTAIAVAQAQRARSFELQAALPLAKLYQSTARPADAHAVLAPALKGFSPTPEMPEIAEAQALLAALGETNEVKNAAAARQRRLNLQTNYGRAVMLSKGYGADEAMAAFARAQNLAVGIGDADEQFSSRYGLWAGTLQRGEVGIAREIAEAFLRDAANTGRLTEQTVAHRLLGLTRLTQGDLAEAQANLVQALRIYDPERDREARFRYGLESSASITSYLAHVSWLHGEIGQARKMIDDAVRRATESAHVPTQAYVHYMKTMLEMLRGDAGAAHRASEALLRISAEHEMARFLAVGAFSSGWARAQLGADGTSAVDLQGIVATVAGENNKLFAPLFQGRLAELEAETQGTEGALRRIGEALALASETGERRTDAFLHRLRGHILLKRDPADLASADEAYRTAIATAQQQGARSYELLASLALAKLCQLTGRSVDAHAVLAQPLEGFSPTPEMPEIAEAQALLAALATDERVREALEKRQARAKIHIDYARAMQWAKGWGADEAQAAVERAHEFAAATPGNPEYWNLTYGRFAVSLLRGEFHAALEIAETYLRQAEAERRPDHEVNARRLLGTVKYELGAFFELRQEFEKLLADWNENRDKGLAAVTGADVLCVGSAYMAQLMIVLGNVEDAVRLSEGAIRRAESLGDFGSLAFASGLSLFVLATCGRIEATLRRAEVFEANATEKGARLWVSIAREWGTWARGLITGDAARVANEFRDIMAARRERQERQSANVGHGLLAQLLSKAGAIDDALASVAEGLALAEQTGHRADSFLHRVRGDILAERETVAAEAAYHQAIRIAQSQGARTFQLQAAHALAKLLERAGRPTDAYAVLAPALEGFSPTPEMPEIAEAEALLSRLA